MADYLDVVAFVGREGKKFPRRIGRAQAKEGGKISVYLDAIPVGPGWDGSLVIEPQQERDGGHSSARAPRRDSY